jgi:hypothetical protein
MKNSNLIIKANIQLLNQNFMFKDLRGDCLARVPTPDREKISGIFKPSFVGWLSKNVDCVQKIWTGRGAHSYHYFAPKGFLQYVELLSLTELNTSAISTKRAAL